MLAMSKEATQKEMAAKLENIKLRNSNSELEGKIKKLMEEVHQKKEEFMVTNEDAGKLKMEFFKRVRDSLKARLE